MSFSTYVWPRRVTPEGEDCEADVKGDKKSDDVQEALLVSKKSADELDDGPEHVLIDARRRLCSREGWFELVGWVAWLCVAALHAMQAWICWYFFWEFVMPSPERPKTDVVVRAKKTRSTIEFVSASGAKAAVAAAKGGSALAGTLARRAVSNSGGKAALGAAKRVAAFLILSGYGAFVFLVERPLLKKRLMPPPVFSVCFHAELFALAGLAMTLCTNFASYVHKPGDKLFDIGFFLVPKIGLHSKFVDVSDVMTGLVPCITFLYLCIFLDRRRRCRATTDWFRMMTVIYFFRCITSTMTSLPGPAPHCAPRAYKRGRYLPPGTWHDIATSLFTAASGGTCGKTTL